MQIAFSSSFKRAFRKRIQNNVEVENRFWKRLEWFKNDPFDARLRTHKLSGELDELYSFGITYDIRVIFYSVFIDIGSHDEVY